MRLLIVTATVGASWGYVVPFRLPRARSSSGYRLEASTDSIVVGEKVVRKEGSMMSSPVFKVLDFLMSIPVVHGSNRILI